MRRSISVGLAVLLTTAALVWPHPTLAGQAGPNDCCYCACAGRPPVCAQGTGGDCSAVEDACFAQAMNATCDSGLALNSSCADVPQCSAAAASFGAPAFGATGLAAAALLLGALGAWRARRR